MISNLGGSPQDVTCPWCSGTGMRQPGTDAQAAWRERQEAAAAAGTPASETSSDAGTSGQADAAGSPPRAGSEQGETAAAEPATGENAS